MGALEFSPAINRRLESSVAVEVAELVDLAQKVISERLVLDVEIGSTEKENAEAIMGERTFLPKGLIAKRAKKYICNHFAV